MKRKVLTQSPQPHLPESQEIKIIYPDILISDEAKEAFSTAYKDLEQAYQNLKSNLDKYLLSQKANHN